MPYNGSGTFTTVNTFVPSTTILSAAVNQNFSDVASGLSDCLTRDGQAGMTAALGIPSGTNTAPGLKFNSEVGTGLYLASTGVIGVAIASASGFSFQAPSTAAGAGIIGSAGAVLMPVGIIQDYCGTAAPTGWLLCYGQEVSQSSYTQLFAVIGTAWGTATTATAFIIPDLRGRALYGKDDMGGVAASRITFAVSAVTGTTLGARGGSESHTLTTAELASHSHTGSTGTESADHTHTYTQAFASGAQKPAGGGSTPYDSSTTGTTSGISANHTHAFTTNAAGSGTAHTILSPAAIVNKIIFAGHG